MKYVIPTNEPVTIVYQHGRATVNQCTRNITARFPTTDQDTAACLEMNRSGLKTIKLFKLTCWKAIKVKRCQVQFSPTRWTLTSDSMNIAPRK